MAGILKSPVLGQGRHPASRTTWGELWDDAEGAD